MYKCKYCGRECKNAQGLHKHERHCKDNPERIPQTNPTNDLQDSYCKYCGKLCRNINSLINHERLCKMNPNRQTPNRLGCHEPRHDMRGKPTWNKGLTMYSDDRVANLRLKSLEGIKKAKEIDSTKFTGKAKTAAAEELRRIKISNTMKANVNAGGLRLGSGRGKKGWYNGVFCDSTYELVYVIYNLDNNIKFKRNTSGYKYIYNDELHTYYPDFELEDGSLVEIKGYYNKRVEAKINSVIDKPIKLLLREDLQYAFDHVENNYEYDRLEDLYNGIKNDNNLTECEICLEKG